MDVGEDRRLASWLVNQRSAIDRALAERLGPRLPAASSHEAEALRRLRSFAVLALARGITSPPSLEGLRLRERRIAPLLDAWLASAGDAAGPDEDTVRASLTPLVDQFREALRSTASAVRASGAPRPGKRRAVSAAIDRVSDVFLAIDPDSGTIADANPAAGALLGTTRDALVGGAAMDYVPEARRDRWWTELDAIAESGEVRRFRSRLRDAQGHEVVVDASLTRFATRARTLALLVARPGAGAP